MECPICAWSPDDPDYCLLYETDRWRVVLAPNQSLIGRCVMHLKRHAGDLADLTQEELAEWLLIVRGLEAALRSAFGATMFNWSCLMNHAYREEWPVPHIHWWAVPRYNQPVAVGGLTFEDPDFGSPYDHGRWLRVPDAIHCQIAARLKESLAGQMDGPAFSLEAHS